MGISYENRDYRPICMYQLWQQICWLLFGTAFILLPFALLSLQQFLGERAFPGSNSPVLISLTTCAPAML